MIAHIPYPTTVPKYYAVASKVATMEFLCSFGLPVPQVYGYSPSSDNVVKTKYIFMEFMRGAMYGWSRGNWISFQSYANLLNLSLK